jgi:signal transduction histidine kinase/HAMP domain-containing protein
MDTTPVQIAKKFARSLSFKLSFYAGVVMLAAILAFAWHSIQAQENNLIAKIIESARKDSEVVKAALWNGMMKKDRQVIREIIRAIAAHGRIKEIQVFDRHGILHYSTEKAISRAAYSVQTDPLLENLSSDTNLRHRISPEGDYIEVVNPLLNSESCSAASCHASPAVEPVLGALTLKIPLNGMREEIYASARKTIVFALLLFLAISTMIGLAVIFLVNPNLRRLQRMAGQVARGEEFDPIDSSRGNDELGDLSRSFEEMSRVVQERTTRLAEGRKLYKSLFELVPCFLTVVSRDYRIVRANKAFLDYFGDHTGKHCYVGYKGLDQRCDDCPVEKTFADGESHESEEMWKLGEDEANVIVKTAPIMNDDGEITEVLEMSLDVTELKHLQEELDKGQREYKRLFENVPCYLTVVDREFNVIRANKLFLSDFNAQIGNKCYRTYKGLSTKCNNCPVEQTFVDGQIHSSEEVWRRNGEDIHIIAHTAPVYNRKGEMIGVMEMSTNITEVKRLQSELALLGETIAGMSHSIKNILMGLQGGVYVLDSGLSRGNDARAQEGWAMVKNNIAKISDLVKGILYASKQREPEYRECDPAQLLAEVCDLFDRRAADDGIEIVRNFPQSMSPGLLDSAAIHSALSNLISNALEACRSKASSDGGRGRVTVGGHRLNGTLCLTVEDNGSGMPEEVKENLFKKYYSTKGSKGTGLGLVLTKKVVTEHKGRISVESELGKGTSFRIELPFSPEEADRAAEA